MSQWNPFEKYTNRIIDELKALAIPDIEYNLETKEYDDITRAPTVIVRDNAILISAEDGCHFADYYGEFRNPHGDPWIHEKLEAWAKEKGFYWEWENPGAIRLTQ